MMLLINCSSCINDVKNKEDKEGITLNWIMPGVGTQKDSEMVWAEFNKRLKNYEGMENISVNFQVIPAGDYAKSFMMLQSEKSDIDIVQTYQLPREEYINEKTFLELDDLIEQYAPNIKKEIPQEIIEYGRYNGNLYFITNFQKMMQPDWGLYTETELMNRYGDEEKMREAFLNSKKWDESCWNVIEEYLENLKNNEKLGLGYWKQGSPERKGYEEIAPLFYVDIYDETARVYFCDELPEKKLLFIKMSDWYQKGYVRRDVLSVDEYSEERGGEGYTVFHEQAWPRISGKNTVAQYGKEFTVFQTCDYNFLPKDASAGGNAIMRNSKHPKEAMKLLNLMNTEEGKDLYSLLSYGIEGMHYKTEPDGRIKFLDVDSTNENSSSKYGLWEWAVGNTKYALEKVGEEKGNLEFVLNENFNKKNKKSRFRGFVVDNSDISVELSQVKAVFNEYSIYLERGVEQNVEEKYNEYMEKLKEAGIDKIKAVYQAQVDGFLAQK